MGRKKVFSADEFEMLLGEKEEENLKEWKFNVKLHSIFETEDEIIVEARNINEAKREAYFKAKETHQQLRSVGNDNDYSLIVKGVDQIKEKPVAPKPIDEVQSLI